MNPPLVPAMPEPIVITFYTKPGCPLCDEAESLLEAISRRRQLEICPVNILQNQDVYNLFWNRIPVLEFADGSTLEPPVTRERLMGMLRRVKEWH